MFKEDSDGLESEESGFQGPVGDGSQLHDESMPRIDFGRTFVRKWPYKLAPRKEPR